MATYCPSVGQSQEAAPRVQRGVARQGAEPEAELEIQLEADEATVTVSLFQLQPVGAAVVSLEAMNVRQLRDFAKDRKIKGYSEVLKDEGKDGLRRYIESQL